MVLYFGNELHYVEPLRDKYHSSLPVDVRVLMNVAHSSAAHTALEYKRKVTGDICQIKSGACLL
jgi:hypothetical protein